MKDPRQEKVWEVHDVKRLLWVEWSERPRVRDTGAGRGPGWAGARSWRP